MTDYQKLYLLLFNSITDALILFDAKRPDDAQKILKRARARAQEVQNADKQNDRPVGL